MLPRDAFRPTTARRARRAPGRSSARLLAATLALLLTAAGCDSGLSPSADAETLAFHQFAAGEPTVLVGQGGSERWPANPVEVVESSFDDDVLALAVRYGGGCRDHDFALVVERVFLESHPVQMPALVSHDAHGDPCRAIVEDTLRFDLTPVKEAYRSVYGSGSRELILRLTDTTIRYTF